VSLNTLEGAVNQKYPPALIEFNLNAFVQWMERDRTGTVLEYLPTELVNVVIGYLNYPDVERDFSTLARFEPDCWEEQYISQNWLNPAQSADGLYSSTFKQALISWDKHGLNHMQKPESLF
jgi:hypothetical protein